MCQKNQAGQIASNQPAPKEQRKRGGLQSPACLLGKEAELQETPALVAVSSVHMYVRIHTHVN